MGDPLEKNGLMYTEKYIDGELIEKWYSYDNDDGMIQIEDLRALVGYDLKFLRGIRVCKRCKKLYTPTDKKENYCSRTCRCEISRHRSEWCDAQIAVKKKIDQEIETLKEQVEEMELTKNPMGKFLRDTLNIYYAIYNTWLDSTKGGDESDVARRYLTSGKKRSYEEYLLEWWDTLYEMNQMDK